MAKRRMGTSRRGIESHFKDVGRDERVVNELPSQPQLSRHDPLGSDPTGSAIPSGADRLSVTRCYIHLVTSQFFQSVVK